MESSTHRCRGQAVVEATLSAAAILIVVTLASGAALTFREAIKHDTLSSAESTSGPSSPEVPSDPLEPPVDGGNLFNGKVIFDRDKRGKLSLSQLELEGWVKQDTVKAGGHLVMVFSRNTDRLVTDGKIGVITCSTNCEN